MGTMMSQITSLMIFYSTVYSGVDQRKHQSSASLAFMRGIHRGPVNSPHKWPVTRKMFPFDDVIMMCQVNMSDDGKVHRYLTPRKHNKVQTVHIFHRMNGLVANDHWYHSSELSNISKIVSNLTLWNRFEILQACQISKRYVWVF